MLAQACSAEDIIALNQNKEYTLTATSLLEGVLTDTALNAQAVKVWQLLFNRARFHPNLQTTISYLELAMILHRSRRSVLRYVQILLKAGYLQLIKNFTDDGSQSFNTFLIRAPSVLIEKTKQTKDRCSGRAQDKLVRRGSDNNFTQNKRDQYKINNNNTDVVTVASPILNHELPETILPIDQQLQIAKLEQEIEASTHEEKQESEKLQRCQDDAVATFCQLERVGQIVQKRTVAKQQLQLLRTQIAIEEKKQVKQETLRMKIDYMQEKTGDRCLSSFSFKRLIKALETYGYHGTDLAQLTNEIVFEVRFGSLIKSNYGKELLTQDKAINIALKLVREGHWRTPTLLQQCEEI